MSRPTLRIGSAARRDLRALTVWLRREADPDTAERFARGAAASFRKLAETPGLGSPAVSGWPDLESTLKWRVTGFPKLLIFYRPIENGVEIVRVLHGARDWAAPV